MEWAVVCQVFRAGSGTPEGSVNGSSPFLFSNPPPPPRLLFFPLSCPLTRLLCLTAVTEEVLDLFLGLNDHISEL